MNFEKGKRFELLVLNNKLKKIIDGKKGIVEAVKVTDLDFHVNYALKTGEDIDIIIETSKIIIAV